MIYLFKVYVLVIGLVLLGTLVVVLAVMLMRVMFTTIGKAAEYALILERRGTTRLKLPVVIEKRVRRMEAP